MLLSWRISIYVISLIFEAFTQSVLAYVVNDNEYQQYEATSKRQPTQQSAIPIVIFLFDEHKILSYFDGIIGHITNAYGVVSLC
jgi:hypothetical protein